MNVLHVCANPKPTEEAVSKQLAAAFFTKLVTLNAEVEMVNLDLCADVPPNYSYEEYRNFWYPAYIEGYVPTKVEITAADYAYKQGQLFNNADVLVLTMPMWNFAAPAVMKSWIDHVISPSLSYDLAKDGTMTPKHKIQRVILLISSGESFKEGDPRDALTPQITATFETIGVEDIALAWADGQNPLIFGDSEDRKLYAIEAAEELAEEVAEMGATA